MILDEKIENEVKQAIQRYKKISEDPRTLSEPDFKYLSERERQEFLVEFIGFEAIQDRERKARLELEAFSKIRDRFAHWIALKIIKSNLGTKLNEINIPTQTYIEFGRAVIENNYKSMLI